MPAAAVIPAPIAYILVVAVKKLVVEFLVGECGPTFSGYLHSLTIFGSSLSALSCRVGDAHRLL